MGGTAGQGSPTPFARAPRLAPECVRTGRGAVAAGGLPGTPALCPLPRASESVSACVSACGALAVPAGATASDPLPVR